eukprot:GHUV01008175.1.p1 GENE.GHUV01008175.1~~GHUV01008175.1.p1  ORF type:complete len:342 (+),score=28.44 GHUV01008175.1:1290-2315(+)
MTALGYIYLVLIFSWAACTATVQGAEPVQCPSLRNASGPIFLRTDCTWTPQSISGNVHRARVVASRDRVDQPGTVVVSRAAGITPSVGSAESPGFVLQLERLVLTGFTYAGPGSTAPLLWPLELLQQTGTVLDMTDVRLVTIDQAVFKLWLHTFTADKLAMYWTDNKTFLHIHRWTDGHTTLASVGLLVQAPIQFPNPLELPSPLVKNCRVAATNSTLVRSLVQFAAVFTPQPLLVYLTTNVSIGAFPELPATGVPVNRPVVFVGLQSLVTSIDFQMVVNQLNATSSRYSNVTFVGVVLENLAPGDAVSSELAPPFSIAVSNNVWAVMYNRWGLCPEASVW